MAYTSINTPTDYFNTKLYTGNGSTQSITGVGFQADLVWVKCRNDSYHHANWDIVRGTSNALQTSTTSAEQTIEGVTSFDSDGFTLSTAASANSNTKTFVSWNWLAGGTAVSNTNGDITSSVSANTTAGFSIVSWTGSGASNTVGHGLNSPVQLIIVKNRTDSVTDWRIGNSFISGQTMADGNGYYLEFDTDAISNPGGQTVWGSPPANPTSTVFKVGSNNSNNGSGDAIIAYCFHSVKGFSKFGSYTGNGSTDGTFVYTGFKPAWIMIKQISGSGTSWNIWDNKRLGYNIKNYQLEANTSVVENTSLERMLLCSNGFKCLTDNAQINGSGNTYIYMAFAESPFTTSTGIPTTAR